MMPPEVSIVITAYRRAALLGATLESIAAQRFPESEIIIVEDGDDGGETARLAVQYGARYFQRRNRPDVSYANCAPLLNKGIREAGGEIVILQNAEVSHASPDVIARLVVPHRMCRNRAVFASVQMLDSGGCPTHWGSHPVHAGPSPYFYCGSVRRENFLAIGGVDEDFKYWGAEDDDLALRLRMAGLDFIFDANAVVTHQWHERTQFGHEENMTLWKSKADELTAGRMSFVANAGREWGRLDS
jgi:GT2 family glycosyltransferase